MRIKVRRRRQAAVNFEFNISDFSYKSGDRACSTLGLFALRRVLFLSVGSFRAGDGG